MSPHRTNDQDSEALLERFRAALHTVDRSPSDEAVGELRSSAVPIIEQLRAEYRAAGHTDDDDTALFRWLRSVKQPAATRLSNAPLHHTPLVG